MFVALTVFTLVLDYLLIALTTTSKGSHGGCYILKPGMGRDRDGTSRPFPLLEYGTKLRMHALISVAKHSKCDTRPLRNVLEAEYRIFKLGL